MFVLGEGTSRATSSTAKSTSLYVLKIDLAWGPASPRAGKRLTSWSKRGYEYVCDWVLDDEPVLLRTRTKPIVGIPYTQECNDVAMMLIQHHKASEYYDRAVDQFEQLYRDAARSARIMALVVPPTSWGRRTASNTSAPPLPTSAPITRCCSGPVRRSSTGTRRSARSNYNPELHK